MLEEAQALAPNDELLRQTLIGQYMGWCNYYQHEWLVGILYGHDGAFVEECEEILQAVEKTRVLDCEFIYQTFLDEFERKIYTYRKRLLNQISSK
ncbi:hypothetical protein HRE53_15890 [Acaryochloris sp. 'Moss Beach']|uniref:hypothetical protein n=1 Tax=Acaryochloris sp. 'Moss Beach' TaxID=2740837 RepID=UPI001F1C37CA|nr:hypothetical protein [Acaryochloris sp. 'Moss Beach']UJB68083.1 hypothetical protein HRE53_15890 [Acaryochloris sp. 'Moss Beach']